tara:strand:- start:1619 stop:2656 length:1038 start_codon:yes stop_codon:yes gene_type:complete
MAFRKMRRELNRDLVEVADVLRIREVYLKAIEEGRFDQLPGPTYATGFVRAYAGYLDLDIEEVMRRYTEAIDDQNDLKPLVPPSPINETRLPTGFVLLLAAILTIGAYGGWYYLTLYGQNSRQTVSDLPKKIAKIAGLEPNLSDSPKSASRKTLRSTNENHDLDQSSDKEISTKDTHTDKIRDTTPLEKSKLARNKNDKGVSSEKFSDKKKIKMENPTVEPVTPNPTINNIIEEKVSDLDNVKKSPVAPRKNALKTNRIVLQANMTSWVELRDSDGKRLISKILKIGDTYKVPDQPGIRFTTGNAGGVDILVDGNKIEPLGPIGAVYRDINMDPDSLLSRKHSER